MSVTLDKLKKLLEEKGSLSPEDVETAEKADGALSEQEKFDLEAAKHEKERSGDATITMEQYLEATKVLDSSPEDSEEHKKALALVEKYEAGN
jgi:hypothetical protein